MTENEVPVSGYQTLIFHTTQYTAAIPLSQWRRGLSSPPILFTDIRSFSSHYDSFKFYANALAKELKSNIDQYNRNWVTSGHTLDAAVSEDVQRAFCLRLLLEDYELIKKHNAERADAKEGSPKAQVVDMLYEKSRERRIKEAAADMLWHLRLPEAALSNLLDLYAFMKGKVTDFDICSYGDAQKELKEYTEGIRDKVFQNSKDAQRKEAQERTIEIFDKIKKQGKYDELDTIALDVNKFILETWKSELEQDESMKHSDLVMHLDQNIKDMDQLIKKMKTASKQKPPKVEN